MANTSLKKPLDPKYSDYVYASKPLVNVYESKDSKTTIARLFIGEWMKVIEMPSSKDKRIHVRYRGGEGYVNIGEVSRIRYLEIFFIDVDQGDSILIQTPEDRRILIDGGGSDEAYQFIKNKYRLDKPDNYIDFDAIIATHSDSDHTQGLLKILEDPKIAVKRFYHNGLFRREDKKVDPGPHTESRVFGLVDRPSSTDQPELTSLMKKLLCAIEKAERNLPEVIKKMKELKKRVDVPKEGFICKRIDAVSYTHL
ncbi:MAG: MBL fold metallo-hydrolase, partial [Chitinispirillaceae bacterium]|nr:MBL fold metallo-hydrolase [Chitinispirillaceae bacterium]